MAVLQTLTRGEERLRNNSPYAAKSNRLSTNFACPPNPSRLYPLDLPLPAYGAEILGAKYGLIRFNSKP
jgi:hypothetical protein